MIAVCCAVADAAIARGSSAIGTMPGSSACMVGISNARAVPRQEQDGEHGLAVEPALHGADRERERGQRLDDLADAGDHAAVEEIEHLSGDDRGRDQRKELHQADEAEIERIIGQGVDLPADRHRPAS